MSRHEQMDRAHKAVNSALNGLVDLGLDDQDLANVMFAYALKIMAKHHGSSGVADHLMKVATRFADPNDDPLWLQERN